MAMVSPPPALGYYTFRVFRETSLEIPEDFIDRVGAALDAETKNRLTVGLRTMRRVRRADLMMTLGLFTGMLVMLGGLTAIGAFGVAAQGPGLWVAGLGFFAWFVALVSVIFMAGLYLRHGREVRQVMAFYHAAQGSSLARDLA